MRDDMPQSFVCGEEDGIPEPKDGVVGVCSWCGERREAVYVCREGGVTVVDEGEGDAA